MKNKSIWHTADEKPEISRYYLEEYEKSFDEICYLVNKRYGGVNTIDNLTTKKWCYLDDLMALETENKDLSDKIGKLEAELERTRKALDVARHTIGWINQMIDEHTDKQAIKIKCEYALEQITALEQKE